MKVFALRRAYALAMIAEGSVQFFGYRPGWALAVARQIARENGRRLIAPPGLLRQHHELPFLLRLLVLLGGGRLVLAYERWRVSNTESRGSDD